jgi:DNA polymerase elongation subunit (family B)
MLATVKFENILFLDIETVPQYASLDEVPEPFNRLWEKKSSYFRKENETAAEVYQRAGIYAEFGKIICISTGILGTLNQAPCFRIVSFAGDHEEKILKDFNAMLDRLSQARNVILCAHNGKEFDFPYIARRTLINGLPLQDILDMAGKKPWEIRHLDTMELWKFGDYKHYTSLELLAGLFNIPSPKSDIDGSMVAGVYWKSGDLPRIIEYCQRDVITISQLLRRYKGEPLIPSGAIMIVKSD